MDAESANFPNTEWSLVMVAGSDRAAAGPALENLCRKYWPPLFSFARRNGLDREAAQDAVQGFILTLIERSSLAGVEPQGSRFRSWLLAGFTNHMASLRRQQAAAKRGGGSFWWRSLQSSFAFLSTGQRPAKAVRAAQGRMSVRKPRKVRVEAEDWTGEAGICCTVGAC